MYGVLRNMSSPVRADCVRTVNLNNLESDQRLQRFHMTLIMDRFACIYVD